MAHYIVVSNFKSLSNKQQQRLYGIYVRCNQCFTVYFIYKSGKFNNR